MTNSSKQSDVLIFKRKTVLRASLLAAIIVIAACNLAGGDQPTATEEVTEGAPEVCGNGVCAGAETSVTCPADCTGSQPTATTGGQVPTKPTVRITTDLNVRFGPSPHCDKVGELPANFETEVLAKNTDGSWWQVPFGNGVAWISVPFTQPVNDVSSVPVIEGPFCAPPPTFTNTAPPPTNTPLPTATSTTAANVCGNGIKEAGEECDGGGTCPGIQFCNTSCTCQFLVLSLAPLSVCGNGVKEAGEVCDPPGGICGSGTSGGGFPILYTCSADCKSCP